tara:strand:- start:2090 stop:3736 length:1647 start_codon:yes stop_codon:yes gene_type:complete
MRLPNFVEIARVSCRVCLALCCISASSLFSFAFAESPSRGAGVLPSEKRVGQVPLRPREILADVGIKAEQLRDIYHVESPLEETDTRTLILRLLYRLARMPQRNLEYWAQKNERPENALWNGATPIGDVFALRGVLREINAFTLNDADQMKFGKKQVFRCQLSLPSSAGTRPAILYTSTVPIRLPLDEPVDAACGALAIFAGNDDATGNPLFIADRLAWYPDSLLGDLKMDVSLLENVQNSKPLRGEEYEAFYQMLAAARRSAADELPRRAYNQLRYETGELQAALMKLENNAVPLTEDEQLEKKVLETRLDYMRKNASHPFVPLVEHPDRFNGELIMLRGTAYRIVKVRVTEPEIRKRLGINHYFQIDMRVNLEHKVKLITSRTAEGESAKIREEKIVTQHPATFCALSLPPGMPTGDHLLEPIRVAGFYFKNWQYQTAQMRDDQAAERVAPMLIGREPVWDVRKRSELEKYGGVIVGMLFLLVLAGIWGIVWWTGRSDIAFGKKIRAASVGDAPPVFDTELENIEISFPFDDGPKTPPGADRENDA